jgi:LPXTG-site transpeptidase (sortase) family protein
MRRTRPTRVSLLLTVVTVSAVVGIAVGLNQLHTASTGNQPNHPATPSLEAPVAAPTATSLPPLHFSLFVPSLGITGRVIHLPITDGSWNVDALGDNVGHLLGTSWFRDARPGNVVLAGHVELRDGRRGIFSQLHDLALGETIVILSETEIRRYRVMASYETTPSDLSPLYPTQREILTLITCSDYDFLANSYHPRLIVVAERI